MANELYPLLNRSEVPNPAAAGNVVLFRDKGNFGLLTAKNFDCSFTILETNQVSDEALKCICDRVQQILDDAGCALKKGIMSADQYQDTVENLNMNIEVLVDPVTGSQQINFSNTATLFIQLTTTDVLCNGGSTGTAAILISGGTAPYTTTWTDLSATPVTPGSLTAGTYIVTVTDNNGKTKAQTFIISEPAALAEATPAVVVDESGGGNNGSITLDITGGTAPYTYLWDDGGAQITNPATGLTAGDYNCVVTDANGCVLNVGPVTVN